MCYQPHEVRRFFESPHLQDFDFLAKEDLGLGQVLLVNALDGHFPVGLLWNTWSGTDRTERFKTG